MEREQVVGALGALAHESRLNIFKFLVQTSPHGSAAGSISDKLGILPATLSFHLSLLSRWGLVTQTRDGRWIYYRADLQRMQEFLTYLTENCCTSGNDDRVPVVETSAIRITRVKKRAAVGAR